MTAEGSFTCPRCGATSHNPNDVEAGYCGRCHDWTGSAGPFAGIRVLIDPDLPVNVIELRGDTTVRIQLPDEPEGPA